MKIVRPAEDFFDVLDTLGDLDEDWCAILCGPDADEDAEPDLDDVFAKPWEDALKDWAEDVGVRYDRNNPAACEEDLALAIDLKESLIELDDGTIIAPLLSKDGNSCGVGAFARVGDFPKLLGAYCGQHLGVHPSHENKGIGKALVAGILLERGEIPVWSLDQAAYSYKGAETVYGGALVLYSQLRKARYPTVYR